MLTSLSKNHTLFHTLHSTPVPYLLIHFFRGLQVIFFQLLYFFDLWLPDSTTYYHLYLKETSKISCPSFTLIIFSPNTSFSCAAHFIKKHHHFSCYTNFLKVIFFLVYKYHTLQNHHPLENFISHKFNRIQLLIIIFIIGQNNSPMYYHFLFQFV